MSVAAQNFVRPPARPGGMGMSSVGMCNNPNLEALVCWLGLPAAVTRLVP